MSEPSTAASYNGVRPHEHLRDRHRRGLPGTLPLPLYHAQGQHRQAMVVGDYGVEHQENIVALVERKILSNLARTAALYRSS
jgi:hypothetical protein